MITAPSPNPPACLKPTPALRKKIEELSGQKISSCYQCRKCTGGCPLATVMDIMPHELMHLLHLGQLEKVLASETIWVCAACETCSTRCPNSIDISHVMDTLRQITWRDNSVLRRNDLAFHTGFLKSVRQYGRVNELRLITEYTLKVDGIAGLLKQASLGLSLMLKGKLKILPERFPGKNQVKTIFENTTKGKNP
jgi:heterodisulfide reductase subunit C